MGRIDEALRRAGTDDRAGAPLPQPAGSANDVFTSPWSFPADGGAKEDAARPPAAGPSPLLEVGPMKDAPMGVFRGFPSELAGRIVASAGASPMLSEQFRRLAATLHHAQLVQGTKVVMITSANPGDGKTLTATNLALTLSESYRRQVLLVDADLRRPSLHEVFRVPNVAGLNDGLKSQQQAKLAVMKITDTLTLLPAGRPDPDPMSSLTSTRMGDILREGAARFDWVIVDTAPIGLLADANLLSTMVDGALLVVRARQTPFAAVTKALENLGRDRVLGVVLNAIDGSTTQNEYYGRYAPVTDTTGLTKAE
jgi:capsular exopolysaccharide synthesis family protein